MKDKKRFIKLEYIEHATLIIPNKPLTALAAFNIICI